MTVKTGSDATEEIILQPTAGGYIKKDGWPLKAALKLLRLIELGVDVSRLFPG